MSRKPSKSFSSIADEILAEASSAQRVKQAELAAVRAATPRVSSEVGELLYKAAADLRSTPADITMDDLRAFINGGAR